jgi:hypothetical protein
MGALREIHRMMSLRRTVVDTNPEASPGERSSRALDREHSDSVMDPQSEEVRRERDEAWKQAKESRRKFVHLGHCRWTTKTDVQDYFEKTPLFSFQGKPGEQHRVFVFSAELCQEALETPWSAPAELGTSAEAAFQFLVAQTAPCDVIVLCDGRSRTCRRKLEGVADSLRNVHEAWAVYKPTKRLGRKVAFGADNKECILVSMPLPRTKIAATPRGEFAAAGEETTHETTYTGVPTAPWGSLPLLAADKKQEIFGWPTRTPK